MVYGHSKMAFGNEPEPELHKHVSSSKSRGKALDLGCGDGRHALYLAKEGYQVTGVDVSAVGLKKLGSMSKLQNLGSALKLHHSDVRDFNYPLQEYDLVAAVTLFDHVPGDDVMPLFNKVADSLKIGGILFVKVHTIKDPGHIDGHNSASELSWAIKHYFEPKELKILLEEDFEILKYSEYDDLDKSHGRPHSHNFDMALARKLK